MLDANQSHFLPVWPAVTRGPVTGRTTAGGAPYSLRRQAIYEAERRVAGGRTSSAQYSQSSYVTSVVEVVQLHVVLVQSKRPTRDECRYGPADEAPNAHDSSSRDRCRVLPLESLKAGPGHQRHHQAHRPKRQNGNIYRSAEYACAHSDEAALQRRTQPDHDEQNEEQLKHGPARSRNGAFPGYALGGARAGSQASPDSPTSVL